MSYDKKNHNNRGVRSMKALIFSAGRVAMECFHFCNKKKSIIFKRTKISHYFSLRERKQKPNSSELIQVFYGLLYPLPKYL